MSKRNRAVWLSLLTVVGVALGGCGRNGTGSATGAFASASPEIKAVWVKAVADDKANNYGLAFMEYKQVLRHQDQLSPDQTKEAEEASAKLLQRIADAADKGDEAAKQALAALGAGTRGQGPPR